MLKKIFAPPPLLLLVAKTDSVVSTPSVVLRPAMTAMWPTLAGRSVVLDVGANVEADAAQLVSFAIMGEAYARATLGKERPTIGLLNIGSEEMKGHDEVREAHEMLRTSGLDLDYRGFVEGDDISMGAVDVVVTDGFTGNVALKTGEGVARMLGTRVREARCQHGTRAGSTSAPPLAPCVRKSRFGVHPQRTTQTIYLFYIAIIGRPLWGPPRPADR